MTEPGVDRHGAPGGRLVILLHGAVVNRKAWLPLARVMPSHYELWCPDLPGHGLRRNEPFTMRGAVDVAERLLAAANGRRAIVAGDSLGGYVALALARRRPPALAGIVAGGCTWSMIGWRGALARASDVPADLVARAIGARRTERLFASLVLRTSVPDAGGAIVAAGVRPEARGESLRELDGMDLASIVATIDVPIVFANGRYDWPTRAGERELVRAARNASLVISPRCGHGIGYFDPPAFASAIERVARR